MKERMIVIDAGFAAGNAVSINRTPKIYDTVRS
jgi:hypothetical protein